MRMERLGVVTYAREPQPLSIVRELFPLLERHYEEVAHYQDIPLDPDFQAYADVHHVGGLRVFTARKDGALIGYIVFFVRSNPHYRSSVQALQDVLFVLPEHRGAVGVKLLRFAERELADEGVQVIMQHVKLKNYAGSIMQHLGYEPVDLLLCKRLDRS